MSAVDRIFGRDDDWSQRMGYSNPYLDPYDHHLTDRMITYDGQAYKQLPGFRFVYDKLWVAQTQGLPCGTLESIKNGGVDLDYPVFIKPRWGHLTASSRNCYKIDRASGLSPYLGFKDMMWSSYVPGREGMTDFLMLNGRIVFQLTFVYSEEQRGNVEVWKYVTTETPPPPHVTAWVEKHIPNHTGFVNVQYRAGKIIEAGMRPARGGAYLIIADNPAISENVYNVFHRGEWNGNLDMSIEPYYSFKCFTSFPIVYVWPDSMLKTICPPSSGIILHEYYFEPVGQKGSVFLQFAHKDLRAGDAIRKKIEWLFFLTQLVVIIVPLVAIAMLVLGHYRSAAAVLVIYTIVYITQILNPRRVHRQLWKAQRQLWAGQGALTSQEEFEANNGAHDSVLATVE